jgi:hypothetical protein
VVGGWEVNGITYLRTGQPFSVTFTSSVTRWFSSRADLVRDPNLPRSERSLARWFDPSAFAVSGTVPIRQFGAQSLVCAGPTSCSM